MSVVYLNVVCIILNFILQVQFCRLSLFGICLILCRCQTKHLSVYKCASVKKGQFVYYTFDDGRGRLGTDQLSTFITRNDTVATYTIQPFGIIHKYKIEWINSCEYKLTPFEPMSWADSLSQRFNPFSHKIVKVDKKYILEYAATMIDTLWIDK